MDLIAFMRTMRRSAVLLIAMTLAGGLAGLGVYLSLPDEYDSRTDLFVSTAESANPDQMQIASAFVQERLRTYVDLADSRLVLEPVIRELDLQTSPADLAKKVSAESDLGTVMLSVDATADTPDSAARLSDAVATSLIRTISGLESRNGRADSTIRLAVADEAGIPTDTSGPRWWFCTAAGLLLGLALGVAAALFRSAADTKIRDVAGVRSVTEAPVLAELPVRSESATPARSAGSQADIVYSEAIRRLRTNLRYARVEDANNAIVVTSSVPGEGKTSTSVDLAVSLAQAGQRVALVDVDLRQPAVAGRLGLENSAGLTTALVGSADVHDLLQPWGRDELYVLTAGEGVPNPTELIESRAMAKLLAVLRTDFDTVILDCPPVLPVADGLLLARSAGRVIHVIAVNEITRSELTEAVDDLSVVGTPLSVVVNKVPMSHADLEGYSYTYEAEPAAVGEAASAGSAAEARTGDPLDWLPEDVGPAAAVPRPHVWPDRYSEEFVRTTRRDVRRRSRPPR